MQTLPIDAWIPDILAHLKAGRNLILQAEPGAGKTTRVPPALLTGDDHVLVLEPRRLAARLAAARVAEERGERLGQTVGYQVRFDAAMSAGTRLLFITEGLLLRRLQSNPTLQGTAVVVLDEFHERHLAGDVSLAIVRQLQQTVRPDLRVVVMSATLDSGPVAAFLGDCPVLSVPGRLFPLEIEYSPPTDGRPLEVQVAEACAQALRQQSSGDILVFLPGAREIRRALEACSRLGNIDVRALHGDMTLEDQRQAILPGPRRKIVLATNVAESSITIEGVRAVVDTGLARVAHHSAWSGLSRLAVERVSQASATQRAGRAGRTGPGRVIRLYPRADFDLRPAFDVPELMRSDLSETVLELFAAGVEPTRLRWFEAPPESAVVAGRDVLRGLGAIDGAGRLTARGTRLASMPVHPRLAALVAAGEELGVASAACTLAALLSYRDILLESRGLSTRATAHGLQSDLLLRFERFRMAQRDRLSADACAHHGIDRATALQVQRLAEKLAPRHASAAAQDETRALLETALAAFPDRVAYRPRMDRNVLLLSRGGSAELSPQSSVRGPWLVALDAEERQQAGRSGSVIVRMASEVDPEWLYERHIEALTEVQDLRFNEASKRVEVVTRLMYDQLPVEESIRIAAPGPETARCLVEAAWKQKLQESDTVRAFQCRYDFVRRHVELPPIDDAALRAALLDVAADKVTLDALRSAVEHGELARHLRTPGVPFDTLAPTTCTVPRRRNIPIHYETDRPPWIACRLQDFFGLKAGPTVLNGTVPLVLHLLAPNGRDVQVTSDLAGFWERTYPQVRKSLSRQYPKHAWPEDPVRPNKPRPE